MSDSSDDRVTTDTASKRLTPSEFETFLEVLRQFTLHAENLPPNEQWKLDVWARENPGLARPICDADKE